MKGLYWDGIIGSIVCFGLNYCIYIVLVVLLDRIIMLIVGIMVINGGV